MNTTEHSISNRKHQIVRYIAGGVLAVTLIIYTILGINSSFRVNDTGLGYKLIYTDLTAPWSASKGLWIAGLDPYSPEGNAFVETATFGRPLTPADKIGDTRHFVYPLYIVFLYAPTIFLDFSSVMLLVWAISLILVTISIILWLKMIELQISLFSLLVPTALFLLWPATLGSTLQRQPVIFAFFFLSVGMYLIMNTRVSGLWSGMLLFLSTVKPQAAVFAIAYILLTGLPSRIRSGQTRNVWIGFLVTGVILLALSLLLVPTWLTEFLVALAKYRAYAGTTGAESFLRSRGVLSIIMSGIMIIIGIVAALAGGNNREKSYHCTMAAYALVLQLFVFPAHAYDFILCIPALMVILKFAFELLQNHQNSRTRPAVGAAVLVLLSYIAFKFWLTLVSLSQFTLPAQVNTLFRQSLNSFALIGLFDIGPVLLFLLLVIILVQNAPFDRPFRNST